MTQNSYQRCFAAGAGFGAISVGFVTSIRMVRGKKSVVGPPVRAAAGREARTSVCGGAGRTYGNGDGKVYVVQEPGKPPQRKVASLPPFVFGNGYSLTAFDLGKTGVKLELHHNGDVGAAIILPAISIPLLSASPFGALAISSIRFWGTNIPGTFSFIYLAILADTSSIIPARIFTGN